MSSILQSLYGSLDAPTIIHQLLPSTQSGDMHSAVYDFAENVMYAHPTCRAFDFITSHKVHRAVASNRY
jgi:hypothetical protein